jgi:hypothetical protein
MMSQESKTNAKSQYSYLCRAYTTLRATQLDSTRHDIRRPSRVRERIKTMTSGQPMDVLVQNQVDKQVVGNLKGNNLAFVA